MSTLRKSVGKIKDSLKSNKKNGYFICKIMHIYDGVLNLCKNEKCCRNDWRESRGTQFILNIFFRKSCRLWDNVEKYQREATDDYMEHAHWMLDKYSYRRPLIICHNYYFSTATMVTRTCDAMLRYTYIVCIFIYIIILI
jgi:hypothetical protein